VNDSVNDGYINSGCTVPDAKFIKNAGVGITGVASENLLFYRATKLGIIHDLPISQKTRVQYFTPSVNPRPNSQDRRFHTLKSR
jgi:hypothetical protein